MEDDAHQEGTIDCADHQEGTTVGDDAPALDPRVPPPLPPPPATAAPSSLPELTSPGVPVNPVDDPELSTYWRHRYDLFSRYDQGICIDREGWFSVTPEHIAEHQARMLLDTPGLVVDLGCCVGGNTVQLARAGHHVLAVDVCAPRLALAAHNAGVYGVRDRVTFVAADMRHMEGWRVQVRGGRRACVVCVFVCVCVSCWLYACVCPFQSGCVCSNSALQWHQRMHIPQADAVFVSPPWGGCGYKATSVYDVLHDMGGTGLSLPQILRIAQSLLAVRWLLGSCEGWA